MCSINVAPTDAVRELKYPPAPKTEAKQALGHRGMQETFPKSFQNQKAPGICGVEMRVRDSFFSFLNIGELLSL